MSRTEEVIKEERSITPRQSSRISKLAIYRLLTKREVKMAGYWPSSFFHVSKIFGKEIGHVRLFLNYYFWSRIKL